MQKKQWEDIPRRKRAIIYCRVSTDKQEQDGESLEYQEEKCRQYAGLHDIEVVIVLKEAKSGFIHYSLRDQLTIARQMVRDGLADMIIVWDLRRFSRNFVHSAMIFEEIESAGAEIVSVSENIDNSLTGKLIRSILAWSAESEREKIVEYANRHWQTRLAQNLPVASGRPPYGWQWKDEDKTQYVIHKEHAAVRVSIFTMFVDEDMSLRGIAHKLTEDGILPPFYSRRAEKKTAAWRSSTICKLLTDPENIGILTICKTTTVVSEEGKKVKRPNPNKKTIPGGIPAIVTADVYELAQIKLKNNKSDKSHRHRNPEDFLLKGHIFCTVCNYRMHGRYRTNSHRTSGKQYPFYQCENGANKYNACPARPSIRTDRVNQFVWEECCRVFERLELIRDSIEFSIEQSLQNLLEDTTGRQLIDQLKEEIQFAKLERDKHPEGSYYYTLISGDIRDKEEKLHRHEEEYQESINIVKLSNVYEQSTQGFLDFLTSMRGKYHEATFAEQRNALDVLGVRVMIAAHTPPSEILQINSEQEWFSFDEAAQLTGINARTLEYHRNMGNLAAQKKRSAMIHRDELACFLERSRRHINLDACPDEWFSIWKASEVTGMGFYKLSSAIRAGELKTEEQPTRYVVIHRDELNRFLRESPVYSWKERENIEPRIEVQYSPIFTGVQLSRHRWHEKTCFRL